MKPIKDMDPIQEKELLERYLLGKCTPAEKKVVETWYREQAAGRGVPPQTKDPLVQREESWTLVHRQIRKTRRLRSLRAVAGVAAATLLFLFAGLALYVSTRSGTEVGADQPTTLSTYGADISPGGNRAILQFSDGQTIELNELHSGIVIGNDEIRYEDGTWVSDEAKAVLPQTKGNEKSQALVLSTPRGGQYEVTLSDGTRVWLNASSTLIYPMSFSGSTREVELVGEAYFDVTHNPAAPFLVKSNGQQIKVFGTQFNVSAYPDDAVLRTTLVSGQVSVSNQESNRSMLLKPGEQAVVRGESIEINPVDVDQFVAWKDGLLILHQTDFPSLLKQIERWYDVTFDIQAQELPLTFSGEVPRSVHLSEILRVLELNTTAKFTINGRRITMTD